MIKKQEIYIGLYIQVYQENQTILTQRQQYFSEHIYSNSICSEQILKLVKPSENGFPDLNTIYIRGQVPDYQMDLS